MLRLIRWPCILRDQNNTHPVTVQVLLCFGENPATVFLTGVDLVLHIDRKGKCLGHDYFPRSFATCFLPSLKVRCPLPVVIRLRKLSVMISLQAFEQASKH